MLIEVLGKVIRIGFFVIVVFTVLAHGTVETWSYAVFEILVLLLIIIWGGKCVLKKKVKIKIPSTAFPFFAFLVFAFIQSFAFETKEGVVSLSIDSDTTRGITLAILGLLAVHLIAANYFVSNKHLKVFANFLTVFGFLIAVFGLLQYFTWNGHIYWLRETGSGGAGVVGPFVNRNHFAGLMELIIPIPIAMILTGVKREAKFIYGFAAIVMVVAAIASLSRGGIISLTIGLCMLGAVWMSYSKRSRQVIDEEVKFLAVKRIAIAFLFVALIVAGTYWIAGDPVANRLTDNNIVDSSKETRTFERSRGWIWGNSIKIFIANPVFGSGLGTHKIAFPIYADSDWRKVSNRKIDFLHAHNDYIQILTDAGIIGGIIALWFIISILFYVRKFFSTRDPKRAAIALASISSISMLMIHSIFDFNLQIVSNALLFLVIVAVLGNAVNSADSSI